jgi:hypothetical protein
VQSVAALQKLCFGVASGGLGACRGTLFVGAVDDQLGDT